MYVVSFSKVSRQLTGYRPLVFRFIVVLTLTLIRIVACFSYVFTVFLTAPTRQQETPITWRLVAPSWITSTALLVSPAVLLQ